MSNENIIYYNCKLLKIKRNNNTNKWELHFSGIDEKCKSYFKIPIHNIPNVNKKCIYESGIIKFKVDEIYTLSIKIEKNSNDK